MLGPGYRELRLDSPGLSHESLGYIACHHNDPCDQDLDMTVNFPAGGTYDVDYTIEPQNGSWPVSMVMYWYE